jgi:hypothetical protein
MSSHPVVSFYFIVLFPQSSTTNEEGLLCIQTVFVCLLRSILTNKLYLSDLQVLIWQG